MHMFGVRILKIFANSLTVYSRVTLNALREINWQLSLYY